MVVLIVAISVGAGVYQTYLKTRASSAADETTKADVSAMRDEIGKLKERVRVLETIVTDKDRTLAEEIRKLA
jgi:phage host-nuclease inhibitor protein Gam